MQEKIKTILSSDTAFLAALIVAVGVASFGLGRVSVGERAVIPHAPAAGDARAAVVESADASADRADPVSDPAAGGAERYVGSLNSDKYHLPWCSGARSISEENQVWFESKEEAEAAGYTPAANCKGI
jgi:hypothetical protein